MLVAGRDHPIGALDAPITLARTSSWTSFREVSTDNYFFSVSVPSCLSGFTWDTCVCKKYWARTPNTF